MGATETGYQVRQCQDCKTVYRYDPPSRCVRCNGRVGRTEFNRDDPYDFRHGDWGYHMGCRCVKCKAAHIAGFKNGKRDESLVASQKRIEVATFLATMGDVRRSY